MQYHLLETAGAIKTFAAVEDGECKGVVTQHDATPDLKLANERHKMTKQEARKGLFGENGHLACRIPAGLYEKLCIENPGFMRWSAADKLKLIKKKMFENSLDRFAFAIR